MIRDDAIMCGSDCSHTARRRFSFSIARSVPEHFNHSIGRYVHNEREIKDTLARQSDAASARLGIDHNFEYLSPADMSDRSAHGVTDDGMEETHRAHHNNWVAGLSPEPLHVA